MKALIKSKDFVGVKDVDRPVLHSSRDVLIAVELAGLCRTDVYVAEGRIKSKETVVLGHEFAGVVQETGADVKNFAPGDRVTVMPVIPCAQCAFCTSGRASKCQHTTMLGIDHDGAFAEYVSVPASTVYKLPDGLSFKHGAYSEPVAAALSVIKSGIQPEQSGLIYGDNRFGQLIERILKSYGFTNLTVFTPEGGKAPPENTFDFAVETMAGTRALDDMISAVTPGGRIVIKSRKYEPVSVIFNNLVKKEITLSAVNYGDFKEAIQLMADGRLNIDDLLGEVHPLEDFEKVFQGSKTHEKNKTFFRPR